MVDVFRLTKQLKIYATYSCIKEYYFADINERYVACRLDARPYV